MAAITLSHKRWAWGTYPPRLMIVALLALWSGKMLAEPSIFDDNWKPAPRAQHPAPVHPAPPKPEPTVPEVRPIDSKSGDAGTPAPAAPRAAIPDAQQLAKTRKLFRELFGKELASREVQARLALARKLIDEGAKCPDKSVDQYVLLAAARQAALEGHDLQLSFSAINALAAAFEVDGPEIKAQAAEKGLRGDSFAATWDNCRLAMPVVDELVADGNYVAAIKLSVQLQQLAAGDPFLKLVLPKKTRHIEALQIWSGKIAGDLEKLKSSPNDPAAAAAVGAFNCYLLGDWQQGLPLLAKGNDAAAKDLAAAELTGPTDSAAIERLAEGWAALVAKQADPLRDQLRMDAAELYRRAAASATGLRKRALDVAAGKLQEEMGPRWVDLSLKADPHEDQVTGKWKREGNEIAVNDNSSRLELPYKPPEEYTFRVDFTPTAGEGTVYLGLTKGKTSFEFMTGNYQNTSAGFQPIDGLATNENRSGIKQRNQIGRRHVVIVEVRNDRLKAYIDGQLAREWPTDYHEFTETKNNFVPRDPSRLAVGAYGTPTIFHRIEVLEYSGSGKQLR